MKQKLRPMETIMNLVFFACGFIAIVFVLFISVYLIISGIPAIREIGLIDFLFGTEWASTAAEPKFGILPFILTSIYGTAGAIVLGVPVGFMTAVFLAKVAPPRLAAVVRPAVDLLAGIPSVVYGLIGMMVLVPAVRVAFNLPDGASLFCAIIVLAVMILPSIISVSETALKAVPKEYEEASLALGATHIETVFRVSVPAASSGIAASIVLGIGRAIGEGPATWPTCPGCSSPSASSPPPWPARCPTPPASSGRPCSPSLWFSFSSLCLSMWFSTRFSNGRRGDILIWKTKRLPCSPSPAGGRPMTGCSASCCISARP